MIQIRKKDNDSYYLTYSDSLEAKFHMLRDLACFNCKRIDTDNWIVPKEVIPLLEKHFDLETITVPWEEIGDTMKLTPYDYQKETVHFGINNGSSLFLLPTGAGKEIFS